MLGYDGSGKSSLLDRLRAEEYGVSTWKDLAQFRELSFMQPALLAPHLYRESLPPLTRSAFLLIALYAEYEFIIAPAIKKYGVVFADSYYLRPIAKELVKGKGAEALLASVVAVLPPPELIIKCVLPLEVAFRRKQNVSLNEVLAEPNDFFDFRHFQAQVLETSLRLSPCRNVIELNCNQDINQVYAELKSLLKAYFL